MIPTPPASTRSYALRGTMNPGVGMTWDEAWGNPGGWSAVAKATPPATPTPTPPAPTPTPPPPSIASRRVFASAEIVHRSLASSAVRNARVTSSSERFSDDEPVGSPGRARDKRVFRTKDAPGFVFWRRDGGAVEGISAALPSPPPPPPESDEDLLGEDPASTTPSALSPLSTSSSPAPAPRSLSSSSPSKSSESDFTPVFLPYNEPPSYPTRPLLLCVPFPSRKLICALSFEASRKGADLVPNLRPRPFRHGFGLSTTFRTLPTCPGRKKGSSFSPASSGDRFLSEDHSRRPNKPSWGLMGFGTTGNGGWGGGWFG
mmetsp:Transcript_6151/g.20542  ORF Transcript_6151/g.20542 Transcript_6151/m.20542 type:complete len:317 (-) Transcript_6151:1107-2057(-)